MAGLIRCPYCVQDHNFRPMKRRFEGRWFICEQCGHTVMPDIPNFVCQCAKCAEIFREKQT